MTEELNEKSTYYYDGYNDFWNEKGPSPPNEIRDSIMYDEYMNGYWDALVEIVFNPAIEVEINNAKFG